MRRQARPRHSPPRSNSSPSSSSSEFEFNVSISPRKASSSLCPADELFYKGQLLPLHLSPRLSLVRTLCSSSSDNTSSSSYSDNTSSARDSTESSSSVDSTASFPLLLHTPPLDCEVEEQVLEEEEDSLIKPLKKNLGGFSLSRFSSVFKKDPKTNLNHHNSSSSSAAAAAAAPSSVKRMSSTAKEVIRKYMKKVKPLYDKLSQKQSTTVVVAAVAPPPSSLKVSENSRGTALDAVPAAPTAISGGGSLSFSGNLMKYTKRGRCAASCPSSRRSSPNHSGVLTRGGFPGSCSSSNNNSMSSSMEELQSAIQGAITHCKNSMLQKSLVTTSLEI